MFGRFVILAATVPSLTIAPGRGAEPISATSGLVSAWTFDQGLESGQGGAAHALAPRDGRLRLVDAREVPGVFGKAVALGVSRDDARYLVAANADVLQLGSEFTIEAWIQPTAVSGWNRLVLRWAGVSQYAFHLALHDGRLSLCVGQADGKLVFAEGGRLEAGRWYHVAGVARRSAGRPAETILEVHLNGRRVGSARCEGELQAAVDERVGIGDSAAAPGAGSRFAGYLDDLALWNRALTGAELAARHAVRAQVLEALERPRREAELARRLAVCKRLEPCGVEEIVFAQRGMGRDLGGHYYANFGYSCADPGYWFHAADGGGLGRLNPRDGEVTWLVDDPQGSVRDPQVHFDAKKILFSYRKGGTHNYHLYEINSDGSGLRQITSGPWDDVEPAYLPDGDIVFCSSRCKRYIGCWLAPSATLHRCDPDGRNLRPLSSGNFTENTPALLPDGRVLYTRWEYVNRDPVSFHHLWTMNPDGTGPMVFFGNMHPGSVLIDAKPIPGSDRVALIDSPGHGMNEHVGFLATLTAKRGPDAQSELVRVSRDAQFRDPYPLSGELFLAARGDQIVLVDARGTAEVLYETPGNPIHEPCPLAPRERPALPASRADLAQSTGTVILADVYSGRNMTGVRRGEVKKLLVLEDLPKPSNFHGGGSQPIGHGVTSTLKRVLGTVPVEADGSAHFEVPAMRSIYFALLDEQDRSLKQMRSFLTVQPGETASCVGCHDSRHQTPAASRFTQALGRPASRIEAIADVPEVLDFPRDIQPILDRHCVACHSPEKREGGISLAGDRGPVYSLSYYALFLHWQIKDTGGPPSHMSGRQPGNDRPRQTYSSASPLMKTIDGSHHGVKLAAREARAVRLWIDVNAQFTGTCAAIGSGQVGGCWNLNEPVRVMADSWPSTPPARDAIERRCTSCHGRMLPRHVTDLIPVSHGDMLSWERPLTRYSRHNLFNLTRPEKSLILLAGLSRQAGGYADQPPPRGAASIVAEEYGHQPKPARHPIIFQDSRDPDYATILAHIEAAKAKLDDIKRFDMPGFRPHEHYVREMKRYGVLPEGFDLSKDAIDVYATDQAYWRSLWHRPARPAAESETP